MTSRRVAAGALAVLLMAAGCTSTSSGGVPLSIDRDTIETTVTDTEVTTPTDTVPVEPATLEWGECDDPEATDDSLECATLSVPLDHDDPGGEHIPIALVRVPAQSADDRVGAILFNPGGPGGSGFDYIAQGGPTLVSELGVQDFDLIGFDPRGVDRSNGLRCQTDAEQDAVEYLDDTPDDADEQAALDAANEQFEAACIAKYGDTLRFYSTDATARDVDLIRAALGDEQVSLLGVSYGTYLFATYATLFPQHVRAMVLDSAFEPTGDSVEEQYTTQLVGFEQAFDNWAEWCQGNDDCAFATDDVGAAWDQLSQQLDDTPVAATDGRLANQTVMNVATISALYSENDWPVLGQALADVRDDADPSGLFDLADNYVGREPDGTYSTIEQSGGIIRCASGIDAAQPDDPGALVAELTELAPRFSRGLTVDDFTDSCDALMPDVTPLPLKYTGDAAISIIGGTNDPATPFRWAEEMDAAMANAGLVTYTGEGHGFLLSSTCVTEIEAATLVDLTVPEDGTVCDPDPVIERPVWWDDLPVPDGVSDVFDSPQVNSLLGLGPTLAYTELHTSELGPDEALDAYDDALEAAGFQVGARQTPVEGLTQGVYLQPDGALFSVIVIGADDFDLPDLEGLAELVPEGETLIVLLALPT